jgi:hypothetical protein
MEHRRFDAIVEQLAAEPRPRRGALRLVAAAALSGLFARAGLGERTAEAGVCAKVGKPCRRAEQCCSGICSGKAGKKTCRSHGAGTCNGRHNICTTPNPYLVFCNSSALCACIQTTAGSSFCSDLRYPSFVCADCERDADCVALGFPPGSACAPFTAGTCSGVCAEEGTTTVCVRPCGAEPSAPEASGRSPRGATSLGRLGRDR